MTPREIILVLERCGMVFFWDRDGVDWLEPEHVSKGDAQRYRRAHDLAWNHWDEFYAELEVHLWRREGVIA